LAPARHFEPRTRRSCIEHASFCGISLGGMTGMWLTAHAPEAGRAAGVVLHLGPPAAAAAWAERDATVRARGTGPSPRRSSHAGSRRRTRGQQRVRGRPAGSCARTGRRNEPCYAISPATCFPPAMLRVAPKRAAHPLRQQISTETFHRSLCRCVMSPTSGRRFSTQIARRVDLVDSIETAQAWITEVNRSWEAGTGKSVLPSK
jgi:pimeloyl-ACP methyl ester carboxylesterase